jgi:hypothetical protein
MANVLPMAPGASKKSDNPFYANSHLCRVQRGPVFNRAE